MLQGSLRDKGIDVSGLQQESCLRLEEMKIKEREDGVPSKPPV